MTIQIFVASHVPAPVADTPLLIPVQAGAALSSDRFPRFLYDNTGTNISWKNPYYSELTVQYWAWKNTMSDYTGLFHYRRYLYPGLRGGRLYRIERAPDAATIRRLRFAHFPVLIESSDMILPRGERQRVSVREQYASSSSHAEADLNLAERILRERSPEYADAADTYLSGRVHYFCNLFIMRRDVFEEYCLWLFPILEEFDRRVGSAVEAGRKLRTNGYLGERLLGVFYTHWREKMRTQELPWVFFEPNPVRRVWKKTELSLLPPSSGRRSAAKRIFGKLRNITRAGR